MTVRQITLRREFPQPGASSTFLPHWLEARHKILRRHSRPLLFRLEQAPTSISDDIKVFYKANRIFAIGFKCKVFSPGI